MSSAVLVFLKYPEAGKVKTRLARSIGDEAAVLVYRRLVGDVLAILRRSEVDSVQIWFDPPEREARLRDWLADLWPGDDFRLHYRRQGRGDLGDRLRDAFETAFGEGHKKVAAIGTDCVEITPALIGELWSRLETEEAVFGPTHDGGYYLLGLNQHEPTLFDVTWSSETTLEESLGRAAEAGLRTCLLPTLPDIDTVEEWDAERKRLFTMSNATNEPLSFQPIYQTRVWGGRTLETRMGRELPGDEPIGESWELVDRDEAQSVVSSGPFAGMTLRDLWNGHREAIFGLDPGLPGPFPLLIKILDARDDLSLQVHPSDRSAAALGGEPKTEAWYVAHADPGAKLYAGLKSAGVTAETFRSALEEGRAETLIHQLEPRTSEVLFIPSGRLHAIGAGLLIYEIQENSDTTYRVYDWNRLGLDGKPRELHVQEALLSIDFEDVTPGPARPNGETLVTCRQFEVTRWDLGPGKSRAITDGRFGVMTVLHGPVRCGSRSFGEGECFLIPAEWGRTLPVEAGDGGASLLRTTLPQGWIPREMIEGADSQAGPAPETDSEPDSHSHSDHEDFYRNLRGKVVAWAETKTGHDNPWLSYILMAPDFFHLLCRLVGDPEVDQKSKIMLGGVIAYFVLPFDLLPEGLIGPAGYLDDLALAAFAVNKLVNATDATLVRKHWAGEGDILGLVQELLERADEMIGSGLVKKIRGKVGV